MIGFQKNEYFWGYEGFGDIFGVNTKLDYFWGLFLYMFMSFLRSTNRMGILFFLLLLKIQMFGGGGGGVYVPGNANTIRIPGIADIIWVNTRSDGSKPT